MRSKISRSFNEVNLEHKIITSSQIHIIDLTERTKSKKGLECFDTKPDEIDTLLIENPGLDITSTFFKSQCFLDERGKEPDNCEGVLYLSNSTERNWILFIEIKDCKSKNISKYFPKAKEQLISVVQIFRDKSIINHNKKVYANISFPRRNKKDFFSQLIQGGEKKEFIDRYKIFIRGTNHLKIKNDITIY